MGYAGSADVGGKHRPSTATDSIQESTEFGVGGDPYDTQELRVIGLSRLTVSVVQRNGAPASFEIWYRIRDTGVPRLLATVAIGAIVVPETVNFHIAYRTVFVRVPRNVGQQYDISIYASGMS